MSSKVLISGNSAKGGRLLTAAFVLSIVLAPASRLQAAQSATNVTVTEKQGVYAVTAQFLVDQPPSAVLAVLTDYEAIPRFMPDVRSSIVRERAGGRVVVEQEAVSSVMMLSKRVHIILEIEEQPDALTFRDRCRTSFAKYEGAWRVSALDGETAITYELTAQPSFDVPGFMLKRLLRRDSAQMIAGLQREIALRAGESASPRSHTPR